MASLTLYVFLLLLNPLWFLYNLVRLIQFKLELKTITEKEDEKILVRHRKFYLVTFFLSAAILCYTVFVVFRILAIEY
jgi:hypothetical protein